MKATRCGMTGHPPRVIIKPAKKKIDYQISAEDIRKLLPNFTAEQRKYIKVWEVPEYRNHSPGEEAVEAFLEAADPKPGKTVVDWGCGSGRGGYKLYQHGMDVTLVDFAFNCLDKNIKAEANKNDRLRFIEHDLSKPIDLPSEYGFCTDVMEHIPEEEVDRVLDTILDNSQKVFFQIALVPDSFGEHPNIQERLHLTVKNYQWWLQKFVSKRVVIYRSNDLGSVAFFYLTGWGQLDINRLVGRLNIDHETVVQNIRTNAELKLPEVKPHEQQDTEIMLLAGGPSLNDFTDEIIENRKNGMKLVTVNGSYKWALDKGLKPSLQLIIDGRDSNARFTEQAPGLTDETKFICASQCSPRIFEGLPKDRTLMWHVTIEDESLPVLKECYGEMYKDWYPCPGGSTVTTRALCLLMMLGYYKFHIYGFDSCLFDGKDHHAYPQPENDNQKVTSVKVAAGTPYEKEFKVHPWHIFQAKDFQDMVPRILKDAKLDIKGEGLIAFMLKTGASIADAA